MVPVVLNKINPSQKKTTRIIRIVSDPYSIESGSISRRPLNTDPNYFITLRYLKNNIILFNNYNIYLSKDFN